MYNVHDDRVLRYQLARYKYGEFTRDKAREQRRLHSWEQDHRVHERQQFELDQLNDQIEQLRREFDTVTSQNGSAHRAAQLLNKHEREQREFMIRAESLCSSRARRVADQSAKEYLDQHRRREQQKQDVLLKRRELFDRDWAETNTVRTRKEKAALDIEEELRKLQEVEKQLAEKVETKARRQRRPLSTRESDLEREAERAIWPERPVANWDLLADDSTLSAIPFDTTPRPPKPPVGLRLKLGYGGITGDAARVHDHVPSDTARQARSDLTKISDPFDDPQSEDFPKKIAEKVYKNLEAIKKAHQQQSKVDSDESSRLYKDAQTNTSTRQATSRPTMPKTVIQHSTPQQPKHSQSANTSYRSLPPDFIQPDQLNRAVELLEKQIAGALGEVSKSSGDSSGHLEQLLDKVDRLQARIQSERSKMFTQSRISEVSETDD